MSTSINVNNAIKTKDNVYISIKEIEMNMRRRLIKSYNTSEHDYCVNVINNIIYNEKGHIVAIFKDYLILDDETEFLKRFYTRIESSIRLPKFFEYYEIYSKIFPNYTAVNERKYIYKNILRKQKMIDLQEKMKLEAKLEKKEKKKKINKDIKEKVFSTEVYDSIINDRNNEDFEIIFGIRNNCAQEEEEELFNKNINGIIDDIDKWEKDQSDINKTIQIKEEERNSNQSLLFMNIQHAYNNSKIIQKNNNNNTNNTNIFFNPNGSGFKKELSLMDQMKFNLFKTKKVLSNQKHNKFIYNYQLHSSKKGLFFNNDNSQNIPITYRDNSNSFASHDDQKSPSTERCHYKNNLQNINILQKNNNTSQNKCNKSLTSKKKKDKKNNNINHSHHHSSIQGNNIIYIINQNPKFTTQINFYNKKDYQSAKAHQNKNYSNSIRHLFNVNNQSYSNPKNKASAQLGYMPNNLFVLWPQLQFTNSKNQSVKKRNVSGNYMGNNFYGYQKEHKTSKELGYKENNLLKNNNNLNWVNNQKERNQNSNSNKIIRKEIIFGGKKIKSGMNKDNSDKRSESTNKVTALEENMFRGKIKGMKIKNFNKLLFKNLLQYQNKTERIINKFDSN